ncbi:MAG: helix-turn-helix transcriptional regulator [Victivallales bacterium]|nr:helix-turn-helix transcriptional regulator [Victivallales bacterium]
MNIYGIYLDDIARRFSGVFPLEAAGAIEDHPFCSGSESGKLELCIRLSGKKTSMKESYNGVEQELRYPNVLIKVPYVERQYVLEHPRDIIYFRYRPELLESMSQAGLISKPYAWHFKMTPDISSKCKEAENLFRHPKVNGIAERLDLLAISLWELLLLARDNEGDDDMSDAEARIRRVAAYLQLHFTDEVDLAEVARKNGFSERNFFRCWKRYFDMSPADFVKNLKFTEAERLLSETNIPITRISEMLGFHNAGYFCNIFRQSRGMTPLKYRVSTNKSSKN